VRRLRSRVLAIVLVALATAGIVAAAVALTGGDEGPPRSIAVGPGERLAPAAGDEGDRVDPLAYDPDDAEGFERRAAAGHSHVLYAKSPGGVIASAERTARWRPLVEQAAERHGIDADMLEAIVMLESAGREDAMAGDTEGAVGLAQILAETGRNLLGLRVDVARSARLTRGINRGRAVERRTRERRVVDERYDPAKALDAAARYLVFAKGHLGRDDLAVVSYHMGVGNLQGVLRAYGEDDVPYAQVYFDSTPLRHAEAWRRLSALGDDSATYLWRVLAAREILRLHREDPEELRRRALLHGRKASREEVLHPDGSVPRFAEPSEIEDAVEAGDLVRLDAERLRADHGLRVDPAMGELVPAEERRTYRALRPEALAVLQVIGSGTQEISRAAPLTVTSTVRDARYQQRILEDDNREATRGYSLHTTGWAFDIRRRYQSRAQALAFQFLLDRLQSLDLISWVREPGAIHVTVGPRARELLAG
jgi:hypothetical protein